MGKWYSTLREAFAVDLRSLAVLRIAIALMILVDLAIRAVDIPGHYSDAGMVPRYYQEVSEFRNYPGRFSFHMMSGEVGLQVGLFVLSAVFAVSLLVGYRTRLSMLGSFLLMVSLQNRNLIIETGADYLLRLVLFWCLFLPLGARFSLDKRAGRTPLFSKHTRSTQQYISAASVALILQMSLLYFFSALHKDHPIWRTKHTAIHYALHIDSYDTSLGEFLRQFRPVTMALTRLTLSFEFASPWFIFGAGTLAVLPFLRELRDYQGRFRSWATLAFILFHLGLGASMSLGTFAWFAAALWLGMFPTWTWDRLAELRAGALRAGTDSAKSPSRESEAEEIPAPLVSALTKIEPTFVRVEDWAQTFEGDAKRQRPLFAAPARRLAQGLQDLIVVVSFVLVALWNLSTVESRPWGEIIRGQSFLPDMRVWVNAVRLDQHWGLFAPYPRTVDGYFVVLGKQKDGKELDFMRDDRRVTWEKPDDVSGSFKTFRWRKYFRDLRRSSKRAHLTFYADYVCRSENETRAGAQVLESVEIYFMRRTTKVEGGHEPTKKELLWRYACDRSGTSGRALAAGRIP